MEPNTGAHEEMNDPIQRFHSVEGRGIFSKNFLDSKHAFSDHCGVAELDQNTQGAFSQVLLAKLNLGGMPDSPPGAAPSSPPRSPSNAPCKHSLLSPGTPLDLPGSPAQPAKKLRRPGAEVPITSGV